MPNAWIDALKKWNEGKGMWCLPKKGTKDYDEVMALMPPKPVKEKKAKAPKASKEEPLPKIAEKVTREELLGMLETYAEDRRKLATMKGAKLRKGMDRIDKLEGAVKDKIKEMDAAAAAPKAKRTIKVSKKVHEAAAPAAPAEKKEDSEEEMKKKAEAAADAAVNKFVLKSKSENRSYLQSRRNAIAKKVYRETLDKLMAEAKEKKKEKVSAIIADRVQKKKFKNIYGEL
jgi:hypothetical protein